MNKELLQLRLALFRVNQLSRTLIGRLDELAYYKDFYEDEQAFINGSEFRFLYPQVIKDYNNLEELMRLAKPPKEDNGNSGDNQDQ